MDLENQRRQQYFEMDDQQARKSSVSSISLGSDRIGFIRKVYAILTTQLLFTVLMCLMAYSSKSFQIFQATNIAIFYLFLIISIIVLIAIFCCQNVARQVPNNYICLGLFTFCESYIVSTVCSTVYLVYDKNGAQLVLASAFLTLGVTASLTLYACTTKSDFTTMGGVLFVCSFALMMFGLLLMFTKCPFLHLIYSCLGAILYGFYLIYDTQLIAGGKSNMLDMDDYIIGALIIYIDVIGLFLQILQIVLALFGKKD